MHDASDPENKRSSGRTALLLGTIVTADPDRALVARLDRTHPDATPRTTVTYRDHAFGVWGGPDGAPKGSTDVALD